MYENDRGTFIFNSKDLCMLKYLPEMLDAGIGSFKIEGRMKSEYYVGVTVAAYRRALDKCIEDPEAYRKDTALQDELMSELCMVSHRDYTTGFYLGLAGEQIYASSSYLRDSDFIGIVKDCTALGEGRFEVTISQRGNFGVGETIDFVLPGEHALSVTLKEMKNSEGELIERAPHAEMDVNIILDRPVEKGVLVRRKHISASA